jgi:hypothetical protein
MQTWHAVVAFQGWSGLQCDGIVGPRTRGALMSARRPTPWSTSTGLEIHIAPQVLLLVPRRARPARDSRVDRPGRRSVGAGLPGTGWLRLELTPVQAYVLKPRIRTLVSSYSVTYGWVTWTPVASAHHGGVRQP